MARAVKTLLPPLLFRAQCFKLREDARVELHPRMELLFALVPLQGYEVLDVAFNSLLSFLSFVLDFLLVARSKSNPTHRINVPTTMPKKFLPLTSCKGWCPTPECKPSPLCWRGGHRSRLGFPSNFWFPDIFLLCEVRELPPIMCGEAPTSTICTQSFDFMIWFAVDVFAFFP